MKDTDFEKDSRAHSFWSEWHGAADRAGDLVNLFAVTDCKPRKQPKEDGVVWGSDGKLAKFYGKDARQFINELNAEMAFLGLTLTYDLNWLSEREKELKLVSQKVEYRPETGTTTVINHYEGCVLIPNPAIVKGDPLEWVGAPTTGGVLSFDRLTESPAMAPTPDADTYLDSLIAKASPQWQGVDADAFMDIVRGREPETFSEAVAGISPDWGCVVNGGGVSLPGEIYSGRGVLFTFDTGARCSHTGNLIIDLT